MHSLDTSARIVVQLRMLTSSSPVRAVTRDADLTRSTLVMPADRRGGCKLEVPRVAAGSDCPSFPFHPVGRRKGLLGVAALLVLAGPVSGVVEQDCAHRAQPARSPRPPVRPACSWVPPSRAPISGGESHDSARFQLDHGRTR